MYVLVAVSLIFAILRFVLPSHGLQPEDTFKDLAHLYVGGLFGVAMYKQTDGNFWFLAGALTVVEVIAAIVKG